MPKPITSGVVVAYAHCPRKAFLLLCTDAPGSPPEYTQMLRQRRNAHRTAYLTTLKQQNPEAVLYNGQLPRDGRVHLLAATLRAQDLEADCEALLPVKRQAPRQKARYEPLLALGTHTASQDEQLELRFVGSVLAQVQRAPPVAGYLVGLGGKVTRVSLAKDSTRLGSIIETLRSWTRDGAPEPPPVILNKHCPECAFRAACTAQAEQVDDLSLLDRMTPQLRQRYHDRGIFSIRQLSYLFNPRRARKHRAKPAPQHKPELQALALRTGKTYLHELPNVERRPVELFLDLEGIPDRRQYYLIGILVSDGDTTSYQGFWADTAEDEATIWHQALATFDAYPGAPIYHYGSYEPRAVAALAQRYPSTQGSVMKRLVNVSTSVYGKVYFPVRSNRLKDIGRFLHVSWTSPDASGLQSLVWRVFDTVIWPRSIR